MPNNPNAAKNLKPFAAGQSGNLSGRRKGSRNRATVIQSILEIQIESPGDLLNSLEQRLLQIDPFMSIEQMLIYVQVIKARHGDTDAYKTLMDAAYGKPQRRMEYSADTIIIRQQEKTVTDNNSDFIKH